MTDVNKSQKKCALGFKKHPENVPNIFLKTYFLIQVYVKTGTKIVLFSSVHAWKAEDTGRS